MPLQCKHIDRYVLSQVHHTEAEWKSLLSPGQYRVLRQSGTELPLSSPLDHVRPSLSTPASLTRSAWTFKCKLALADLSGNGLKSPPLADPGSTPAVPYCCRRSVQVPSNVQAVEPLSMSQPPSLTLARDGHHSTSPFQAQLMRQ